MLVFRKRYFWVAFHTKSFPAGKDTFTTSQRLKMMHNLLFLLFISSVCKDVFSSPLPTEHKEASEEVSDDVKELESLRNENPVNTSALQPVKEEAKSRNAIFRHRGITEAKKNGRMQSPSEAIQYSPTDLAAYVFNTGDEEGVAVAVEELVREGMLGRTDAINYLQDVKQILNYLREQYESERALQELKNKAYPKQIQRLPNLSREHYFDTDKRESKAITPQSGTTQRSLEDVIASTSEPNPPASTTSGPKTDAKDTVEEYKEMDSKRRVPPEISNSFTLEVIYKLAKAMFTQSIIRDDPVAEETLSRLIDFLQNEVRSQRISPAMKERVLEVISTALVDSLHDSTDLLLPPENQPSNLDAKGFYPHLPDSKVPMSQVYREIEGHDNLLQQASKSNRENSS